MKKLFTLLVFVSSLLMLHAQYITVGSGTTSENYPLRATYYCNISQQIYLASEMGGQPVKLHALALHQHAYVDTLHHQRRHLKVYLTTTTQSSFGNGWINNVNASYLVYDGYFYLSVGDEWTSIDFNAPFFYDGTSNLVVTIIDDMDNSIPYEFNHRFICSGSSGLKTRIAYRNSGSYTLTTLDSASVGSTFSTRANIRFFASPYTFNVLPYIEIGTGANQSNQGDLPTNAYYKNSCSEQIFTNAELGGTGTGLYGVQFYQAPSSSCSEQPRNVKVYLTYTTASSFSSNTAWASVVGWEKVYEGAYILDDNPGWRTIWFDNPAVVSNGQNMVLVVVDTNDSYHSGHQFSSHTTTDQKSIYIRSDGTQYDAESLFNSSTTGSRTSVRSNVRFIKEVEAYEVISCHASGPTTGQSGDALTFTVTGPEGASFSWDIEDGSPSTGTGSSITTTWNHAGTYTVTVYCSYNGQTAMDSRNVEIYDPFLSISVSGPSTGQQGEPLTFTANGPSDADYSWSFENGMPSSATGTSATCTWDSPGTYTVSLNATRNGQTAFDAMAVTVTPGPVDLSCSISGPDRVKVNTANSYTATVSGASVDYVGLHWEFENANVPTASGPDVSIRWTTPGDYRVAVTASYYGQTATDEMMVHVYDPVGIDVAGTNNVTVYPNPTAGKFTIEAAGLQQVEVLDAMGRTVLVATTCSIDLTGCATGVYTLRVLTAEGTSLHRVLLM